MVVTNFLRDITDTTGEKFETLESCFLIESKYSHCLNNYDRNEIDLYDEIDI